MLTMLRRIVQEVNSARDFGEALQTLVQRIREAIATEACSVFLIDQQTKEYILMATDGLKLSAVGAVRLRPNEGLVGLVGEREEPLNLENAPVHPNFSFHPEVGEERFKAFLGVPIIHHRKLYGVLVVQQEECRRFDETEEAFLVTMSAQLAGIIAHAEATGAVAALFRSTTGHPFIHNICLEGIACSPGVTIGKAVIVYPPADLDAVPDRVVSDIEREIKIFNEALHQAREEIKSLAQRLAPNLPEEEQALFEAYLRILDNSGIGAEVIEEIKQGRWAQSALRKVIKQHIRHFEELDDPYLKERATDIRDLGRRVLAHLQEQQPAIQDYPLHTILMGEEVTAAALAEVPEGRLVGVISAGGSTYSHVAILSRALGIPAVMGVNGLSTKNFPLDGLEVIVDGYQGQVYIAPSEDLRQEFSILAAEEKELDTNLAELRDLPAVTPDGYNISLLVNAGLAADAGLSLSVGAEGVGLYRTEIAFMARDSFPTEEEQRILYRQLLKAFSPRPVVMRTLDIGGDKPLPYFSVLEENPYLGWRGIRITLDHPDLFLVQLRAMLKANYGLDNLRIMLPMISSIRELEEALDLINQAYHEVVEEEQVAITKPPIGVMVEVPSMVYLIKNISSRVDFLSVGSNDLIQYLLAVDRNNARVATLYDHLHPSVIQALMRIIHDASLSDTPVSICGEMANDPVAVVLLMGMGFQTLSMNSVMLPRVKWVIRSITMEQAKHLVKEVCELEDSGIIRYQIEKILDQAGLGGLIRGGK